MKSLYKSTDELLLSATVKDVNEFFEQQKNFLIEYHNHLREATVKADRMTARHKGEFTMENFCFVREFDSGS